jgi:hypothetical protein
MASSSPDVTLAALQLRKGARFIHEHDLIIPWRHEVRIEDAARAGSSGCLTQRYAKRQADGGNSADIRRISRISSHDFTLRFEGEIVR